MSSLRRWSALTAVTLVALCVGFAPAPALAQDDVSGEKKVTLDLKDVPLRSAIGLLFAGSGLQYQIDPNVPNVPVNLNIRDIGLINALRLIVRQAGSAIPGLRFNRDGAVYSISVRPATTAAPPPTEELPPEETSQDGDYTWEKIPVQFNSALLFAMVFGGTPFPTEDMMGMGGGMGGGGMMGGMGGGMGGMGGGMGGMGGGMMGGGGGLGNFGGGGGGFGGGGGRRF